ncbi:hypothetical protein MXB_3480, partial [Myxobolus squamalis]
NSKLNTYSVNSTPKDHKNLIPEYIEIEQYNVGKMKHICVSTKKFIGGSNIIGMFEGTKIKRSETKQKFRKGGYFWKVYHDNKIKYVIDAEKEERNWLKYISKSRNSFEQNIDVVYDWENDTLLFIASRNINIGEELLAWYKKSDWMSYITSYPKNCGFLKPREPAERLRVHVRQVHDKIKPYKCSTCTKEFSQSSSLTKHMRIHNGSRPYKCLICEKVFTASSILTTHMRQHTGEKPFKCTICKKGFASHAAHHSHVRRSHKIEPQEMKKMSLEANLLQASTSIKLNPGHSSAEHI